MQPEENGANQEEEEKEADNVGWTTVGKKKKPNPNRHKPKKYVRKYCRELTPQDFTLTEQEKALIQHEQSANPNLKLFCNCCQSYLISDIIRRTFLSCGVCYCCAGDDPAADDPDFIEQMQSCGCMCEYNKEYHYTRDKEFR